VPGPTNKRVYFACLGVAKCQDNQLLHDVISAEIGLNVKINNILSPGSTSPVATYSDMPDVDFSYTSYLTSFVPIASEYGLNSFCGFNMAIGLDSDNSGSYGGLFSGPSAYLSNVSGSPPYTAIGCSLANLVSVTYSLPVDGFFTVTRTYKGFSKKTPAPPAPFTETTGSPKRRQCFTGTLPAGISNNAPQNIDITYNINRTPVPEFATRRPYASYVNFPIETTVTFDLLTQGLDSYTVDAMQTACKNIAPLKEDITISVQGAGTITLNGCYLTSLRYSGGAANSSDNQTISATYTSYQTIPGIKPVVFAPEDDPCD
jgi:hypothetical protein